MKIGIIVHSQTGNTYSVVYKLQGVLIKNGHSVNIERITPVGNEQVRTEKIQLSTFPDTCSYDAFVFAAPVRGASISPVLSAYLSRISTLESKKVICIVTQYFPFAWMGGNRAINQMKKICISKEAIVCGTGIVNWSSKRREKIITEVINKLSSLFS